MDGFAQRLRKLRKNKNMTLQDLAVALDTTKTTLSRYENNKRLPDADFIVRTAQYFNVSADYLLNLSNHPTTVSDFLINNQSHYQRLDARELKALRAMIAEL